MKESSFPTAFRLVWLLSAVILGAGIGRLAASGSFASHLVLLAGSFAGIPVFLYLAKGLSYEKAVVMMVLALPLMAGFVIDIGGYLRVPYLFTILAFCLCLYQMKLRKLPQGLTFQLLFVFVFYALASTAFTLWIDFSRPIEEGWGFRLSPFRSFIQAGQLILMLMSFYLTVNYATSLDRIKRIFNFVFWSTVIVLLYGIYDFLAALYDLPFLKIVSDMGYYQGGIDTPAIGFGGVTLPRPRSTFLEPIELSLFLLFGIPYSIAAIFCERSKLLRRVKVIFTFFSILLFFAASSRSSLIALLVVLPLFLFLIRSHVVRLHAILLMLVAYLSVAFILLPLAGGQGSLMLPITFYQERLASVLYYMDNLRREDAVAHAKIGREYSGPVNVFQKNPTLGVGLGNFSFYVGGSAPVDMHSTNNMYLRLLIELGIVGTSFFLLFLGRVLWVLFKFLWRSSNSTLRPFALASFIAIVGVMIAIGATEGLYTHSYLWVMFAMGVAVVRVAGSNGNGTRPVIPL